MKKFLLLSAFAIACISVNATIRTVSNFPANVAQFASIDGARAASSPGDTILVQGSPIAYGAFTVDKKLTIIGPGWSPNKQLGFTAIVAGMTFSTVASSGTEIQGLVFVNQLNFNSSENVNDIKFIRNQFSANANINFSCCGVASHNNFLFEGNFFSNSRVSGHVSQSYSNFIFQNNLFFENGTAVNGSINGFTIATNILFDHNLFYGPATGSRGVFQNDGGTNNFFTITNNIFVGRDASGAVSSTFANNITFNAGNNAPWNANGNVNTAGNLENIDPQMADQASVNAGTNNPLLNFTIAAGPANNSGSDSKDRGLLFDAAGSLNWNNSRMARLPFINIMNVTTPTVAPGGNVQVNVEAKTNN